jgi:beta-galactosidase
MNKRILLLCISIAFATKLFSQSKCIDTGWKFFLGGVQNAESVKFNDLNWRNVDLPHDWSIEDLPGKKSPFDRTAIGQVSS